MRGKKNFKIITLFIILIFSGILTSGVYVGITDGYIKDLDGNAVDGASVNVVVSNCFGDGCSLRVTSQSDGYYIAPNLNLPKNGNVIVSATKSGLSGSSQGTGDQYHVAHVNVVLCVSPTNPKLKAVADSHNSLVDYIWESGKDPKGRTVYDEVRIDNGPIQREIFSPYQQAMNYGNHSWQVRTCNQICCSNWARDSFYLWNNPPSIPIVQTINENGIISVSWTSGNDPDGDLVYDEFLEEGGEMISPAISPRIVPSKILYQYKVRTCDNFKSCSQWVNVSYVSCDEINQSCPNIDQIQSIQKNLDASYAFQKGGDIGVYCNGIKLNNNSLEKLNLQTLITGEDIKVEIYTPQKVLKEVSYCPWCYNQIRDYDEIGVDCGGKGCASCEKSPIREIIRKILGNIILIIIIIIIIIISIIGYYYYKKRKIAID